MTRKKGGLLSLSQKNAKLAEGDQFYETLMPYFHSRVLYGNRICTYFLRHTGQPSSNCRKLIDIL